MSRKKDHWQTVPAAERKKRKAWKGISRVEKNEAGEYRFRTHVTWTDENGKQHQTETRICSTPEECRKEAKALYKYKEEETASKTPRLSQTIQKIYEDEFLPDLEDRALRITTEPTTGDVNRHRNALAMLRHYMPPETADTKIRDITAGLFGAWLAYINGLENLSGNSVRRYKTVIVLFVVWLRDHGYFTDDTMDIMIRQRLGTIKIKSRAEGARTDRVPPSVDDLLIIIDYYREKGLDDFRNIRWLVLWVVLFCSGIRVEELSALRVSSYDPVTATLTVDDAICDREDPRCVKARKAADIRRMKNAVSVRKITVMKFYKGLLDAYLERYKERLGDDDGYLFPRLVPGNEAGWMTGKMMGRELARLKERLDLHPGIDSQMFRHGCATFLIRDMDLSYDAVHAYFGHSSSEMLRKVYGTLNLTEKQDRANTAMSGLLAAPGVILEDPEKARRRAVMMLSDGYDEWMQDLIEEIKE